MDELNALPKFDEARTPWGDVHFEAGHGGWWAVCPVTGFGYWYPSLRTAVRSLRVEIIECDHGSWIARSWPQHVDARVGAAVEAGSGTADLLKDRSCDKVGAMKGEHSSMQWQHTRSRRHARKRYKTKRQIASDGAERRRKRKLLYAASCAVLNLLDRDLTEIQRALAMQMYQLCCRLEETVPP